jgi:hypothetical protein
MLVPPALSPALIVLVQSNFLLQGQGSQVTAEPACPHLWTHPKNQRETEVGFLFDSSETSIIRTGERSHVNVHT